MNLVEVREYSTLTYRVRTWIKEFAATDGSLEAAARTLVEVGYKDNHTINAKARRMIREHRAVIAQQVVLRLKDTGRIQMAMATVDQLTSDKEVNAAVRLNGAKDIMAKAGLEEARKIDVVDTKDLSDSALRKRIAELEDILQLEIVDEQ